MSILKTNRVLLDTWVLKRLSRGDYGQVLAKLENAICTGQIRVIVTMDHVMDFCRDKKASRAHGEASFVDTLRPLWMTPGNGISHMEAFAEFQRLCGIPPLDEPSPCSSPGDALCQWWQNCPCTPEVVDLINALRYKDTTFSGRVKAKLDMFEQGIGHSRGEEDRVFDVMKENQLWAKAGGMNWDRHFRNVWTSLLSEGLGAVPKQQVIALASRADLARMPALSARLGVEKAWGGDRFAGANRSDAIDKSHVMVAAYVDYFVTEGNLASLLGKAHLQTRFARVFDDPVKWASTI